jgi:hypothetical protein
MKICPLVADMLHADGETDRRSDGRTDMTKLIDAFRNSTNGPKKPSVMSLEGKVAVCSEIDTKHKFAVWAEGRIS